MTAIPTVSPRVPLIDVKSGLPTRQMFLLLNSLSVLASDISALVVINAIVDGITDQAPSSNAVHDALASLTSDLNASLTDYLLSTTASATYLAISDAVAGYAAKLEASTTYDPPSLADGVGTTTTLTLTGAVLGDYVLPAFSLDTSGITITAWVSAADTVSVRFQNESGGTLDIASGTLSALILR